MSAEAWEESKAKRPKAVEEAPPGPQAVFGAVCYSEAKALRATRLKVVKEKWQLPPLPPPQVGKRSCDARNCRAGGVFTFTVP